MVVADEPERPRRRVGGPQRRRQQYLVRRLIGVGVGVAFLILVVIAFRGCLQARSDRALRNYDSSIATIMQQSEQSGKDFFQLLNSPSGSSSVDVQNQVLAQRDASSTLLDRAQGLSTPGQMHDAQSRRRADPDAAPQRAQLDRRERHPGGGAHPDRERDHDDQRRDGLALRERHPLDPAREARDQEGPRRTRAWTGSRFRRATSCRRTRPTTSTRPTLVTKLNAITGGGDRDHRRHPRPLSSIRPPSGARPLSPDSTTNVPSDAQEIDIGVTNSGRQRRDRDQRHRPARRQQPHRDSSSRSAPASRAR